MNFYFPTLLTFLILAQSLGAYSQAPESDLFNDLLIVEHWNKKINDRFPVTYNNYLQGGYFIMPSARMGEDGEVGLGFASVPPYRAWSLRVQLTRFLEVTGNYRIFSGVEDPLLSPFGFGDFSDKGANIKIALFNPEDSNYQLPGVAFGFDDIMGTRNFKARYIVATKVFLEHNMELSFGYGEQRIRGFFGGWAWMPWRTNESIPWLKPLTFAVEFDATPYKSKHVEKHPDGRIKRSPYNLGIKYRLWDHLDFSLSYIRGAVVACGVSGFYNFGQTKGILPKYEDPLPYMTPVNLQPISLLRPEDALTQDLIYAFRDQGIELLKVQMYFNECLQKSLRISIYNDCYRVEHALRYRITSILAALIPMDIEEVKVVLESEGFPIQEYRFFTMYLENFRNQEMCEAEMDVLSPMQEVSFPDPCTVNTLFKTERHSVNFEFYPRINTFFGSAKGKFKYSVGLGVAFNGFLPNDLYYSLKLGYAFFTNLGDTTDVDLLNPSQLLNVRTDSIRYFQKPGFVLDEAFLQKNWNLGRGWFAKVALGYFEQEYGGLAGEVLYYPVKGRLAFGLEGAAFLKRTYQGLGFTTNVRQLHGYVPYWHHHFVGSQFFASMYYNWKQTELNFKVSAGKFLANDYGARFEVARYFPSGLIIFFWYTMTNGNDHVNGKVYYDKGIGFSMPIDIFLCCSSRDRWGNAMSAWLRDVGATASNGLNLYELIREQRE